MRKIRFKYLLILAAFSAVIFCASCVKEDNEETSTAPQESENESENQDEPEDLQESTGEVSGNWLSSGKWDEYLELLTDFAAENGIETEYVDRSRYVSADAGIVCDLDCDGIAPEMVLLETTDTGYTLNVYYIANDGNCTVTEATCEYTGGEDYVAKTLYLSKSETCSLWDIVVEEDMGSDTTATAFFEYENSVCTYCGYRMGSLKSQGMDADGEEIYEYYGVYVIDDGNQWNGYTLTKRYTVNEAAKSISQIFPDYFEEQYPDADSYVTTSSNPVSYYDISGADYITIPEGTYYTPMDFSKIKQQFVSTEVLPIGYVFGEDLILVESSSGEIGYVAAEKLQ